MPAMIGHSSHISQINRRKCDKNYSLFRIASLHVACGRDQFYIRVSIVPIFGNGATLGKRSNWYFLELCCAKLGSLTRWCLVVARRLFAELQKRKKLAPTNFLTQKISTKKWPKNYLKLPNIAQKWPKIAQIGPKMTQNCQNGPKMTQNGPKISTS